MVCSSLPLSSLYSAKAQQWSHLHPPVALSVHTPNSVGCSTSWRGWVDKEAACILLTPNSLPPTRPPVALSKNTSNTAGRSTSWNTVDTYVCGCGCENQTNVLMDFLLSQSLCAGVSQPSYTSARRMGGPRLSWTPLVF